MFHRTARLQGVGVAGVAKRELIQIRLDAKDLLSRIKRTEDRARVLRPALEEIGEIVKRSIVLNFKAQGRPKPWAPFSPNYKRKRGSMSAAKLLVNTARLRNSISWRLANQYAVDVGTNVKYAAAHQYGSDRDETLADQKAGTGLPARPFVMLQDEDYPRITGTIESHILKHLA